MLIEYFHKGKATVLSIVRSLPPLTGESPPINAGPASRPSPRRLTTRRGPWPDAVAQRRSNLKGLVLIRPGACFVDQTAAVAMGRWGPRRCTVYTGIQLKQRMGFDDALDAFGVHACCVRVVSIVLGAQGPVRQRLRLQLRREA